MEILALAIFSNWVTYWFTPLNWFREILTEAWVRTCIKAKLPAASSMAIVLSCPKCFGFWFTLFYKQDFWLALIVAFLSFVIKFVIDKIEWQYE